MTGKPLIRKAIIGYPIGKINSAQLSLSGDVTRIVNFFCKSIKYTEGEDASIKILVCFEKK